MTKNTSRTDGRMDDEVRKLELISGYTQNAPGSVLVSTGDTRIICTATFEEEVPGFLKLPENGYKHGWVTAEYGMLPGSTGKRKRRERPQVDVWIDCDVIQADGGTRTASITGGFVALILALRQMQAEGRFKTFPVSRFLASISVGIFEGRPLLDLKYDEDVKAEVDMNVVMLDNGDYVEVQGTAEGQTFPRNQLNQMLDFAEKGIQSHLQNQKKLLGENLESGDS